MPDEYKDLQNKIKYSIWETRLDESQLKVMEEVPESIKRSNLDSNKEYKKEN